MEESTLLKSYRYTHIDRAGSMQERAEEVLVEHSAALTVNGIPAGKITCIPEHLDILILGRLLTEGRISSAEDVAELRISESADLIEVTLTEAAPVGAMEPLVPVFWKPEWIFDLADHFAAGTPLHEKTWATHSCILAKDGEILFTCEDISRHNALDKAIGFALRSGLPLRQCMVYSSGRIPTDMAVKAVRSGIPVLVSKASPTAAAVELARQYRLTLICAARKDRMKLFSGPLPEEASGRKESVL